MEFLKLALATDHAGFELGREVKAKLLELGLQVIDLGCNATDSVDYPDYGARLGEHVSQGLADAGLGICGSGLGMAICANKFARVRAVSAWDEESAKLGRLHNNANVLCLGARLLRPLDALRIVEVWLQTPFASGRHANRLDKIAELERKNLQPRFFDPIP